MQTHTQTVFAQIHTYSVNVGPEVQNLVGEDVLCTTIECSVEVAHLNRLNVEVTQIEHVVFEAADVEVIRPAWISDQVPSQSHHTIRVEADTEKTDVHAEPVMVAAMDTSVAQTVPFDSVPPTPLSAACLRSSAGPRSKRMRCKQARVTAHPRWRSFGMQPGHKPLYGYAHAPAGPPRQQICVRQRAQSP